MEEFLDHFTGVVLEFSPGPEFRRGGQDRSPLWMLPGLLRPYRNQLLRLMVVASALLVPNLLVAGLTHPSSPISSRRNGSISGFPSCGCWPSVA